MTDITVESYYYNAQIRKYIVQFMAIFSGLQVSVGKNDFEQQTNLVSVPIIYGAMDRVVAAIKAENTQNKPIRVPLLATEVTSMELDPELRRGVGTTLKTVDLPLGGVFPNDLRTITKFMPIPYRMGMEVAFISSNSDQQFQMMEQIMMLFDPILQIQRSDGYADWTKITTVTMESINFERNYPAGTERRLLVTTMNFTFPIHISPPVNIRNDVITKIKLRIDVAMQGETAQESAEANSIDFDGYETLIDANDENVPKN